MKVDQDVLEIDFADAFALMRDLRAMGENNCQHFRRPYVPRDTLYATAAAYKSMYGKQNGAIPATFQVLMQTNKQLCVNNFFSQKF